MILIGTKCRLEQTVTRELTAEAIGSGALPVFGTPFMAAMMENAAMTALQSFLEEGQGSVGTHLDISHDAPTPVGMTVYAEAEITAVSENGRMVDFQVPPGTRRGPSAREPTPEPSSGMRNSWQSAIPSWTSESIESMKTRPGEISWGRQGSTYFLSGISVGWKKN